MLFNSVPYAIFLPIVFVLYWILPQRFRWILILISSYFFYMSWNPKYVFLIAATTLVSFGSALVIERTQSSAIRKLFLVIALIFSLGILFVFKYLKFSLDIIERLFHSNVTRFSLILPVGISFYTFQTLSYVIDVYKGEIKAEKNLGIYATFISFFPQLVAGPIERTRNLLPQIRSNKTFDHDKALYGARLMLWGFFKKIAIADVIALYVDSAYGNLRKCSGFDLWCAVFFFTLQIYCDFSGYSDIAIGTAKLFGIDLIKNFDSPYFATSIRDFWSRWHISLSTWFRDYVYIPLGGNRCSKFRNSINVMITFLLSGLWHGAGWTYVVWGGLHGLAQVVENLLGIQKTVSGRFLRVVRTVGVFVFVSFAWIFFRADSFSDAFYVITNLFRLTGAGLLHSNIGLSRTRLLFSIAMILIVAIYDMYSLKGDVIVLAGKSKKIPVLMAEYMLLALMMITIIKGSGAAQFVYFQF